jgi:hypothetical protein
MTRRSFLFALAVAAAFTASQARAASITTLFSTGVDDFGAPLPNLTPDLHYTVSSPADPTVGPNPFALDRVGFPFPPWVANTPTAQWVIPKDLEKVDGAYNYTTTFNLTGFNPATASITGNITSDDQVVGIVLNGNAIAFSTPDQSYATFFALPAFPAGDFVSGINTLEFLTMNTHGIITGLIVDMAGTAESVVPEPASMSLLGIGLTGLFAFRRFFKRASAA